MTQDLRRAAPYAAYAEMDFDVPVEKAGDVRARLLVRALEIMESCRILRQALNKLPPGEIYIGDDKFDFVTGTATSRVEAPRGEVFIASPGRKDHVTRAASTFAPDLTPTCRPFARWCGRPSRRHASRPGFYRSLLLLHAIGNPWRSRITRTQADTMTAPSPDVPAATSVAH